MKNIWKTLKSLLYFMAKWSAYREKTFTNLSEFFLEIVHETLLRFGFSHHCWHFLLKVAHYVCIDLCSSSSLHKLINLQTKHTQKCPSFFFSFQILNWDLLLIRIIPFCHMLSWVCPLSLQEDRVVLSQRVLYLSVQLQLRLWVCHWRTWTS